MKCKECGSTQVGLYKEVRSFIAECGITKADIKEQINATTDSMIRSSISEKMDDYITNAVKSKIGYLSPYDNSVKKIIIEAIKEIVAEQIANQFSIKIEPRAPKEDNKCTTQT